VALHFAKFNLNNGLGAAVVDGHKGLVSLMGMGGAYGGLNVTVAGDADTHVLMAGNALWVNTTTLSIAGAAEVSVFAVRCWGADAHWGIRLALSPLNAPPFPPPFPPLQDICVAQCLPSQHYFPKRVYPDTMQEATRAIDAIRRLGALDVKLNFPYLAV
jgi:hypothetical protein